MATKIGSAKEAVQVINEISDPYIEEQSKAEKAYAVADYVKQKTFRTTVDRSSKEASEKDYYAGLHNTGAAEIVSFQPTRPHVEPFASIKAWFVPMVSIDSLIHNHDKFPAATLAIIDLAYPQPPFICTEKLTGCCFVIGWDENNGRLYLGHIQPSEEYDRTYIAEYVRENEILPVRKSQLSKYICFGGNNQELPSGYNKYTLNIVGFILLERIWMVFHFQYRDESGSMIWDLQIK